MRSKSTLLPLFLWVSLGACSWLPAQHWYEYSPPPDDFDWQLFAPVHHEFYLNERLDPNEGYFFNSGRGKFWIMRPNRAPIGVAGPAVIAFSPNSVNYIYTDLGTATLGNGLNGPNANDSANLGLRFPIIGTGSIIQQFNAIDDAYSSTADGWGNHWEFGWVEDDHGWMCTLYQGIDMGIVDRYGFDDKRRNQLGAAQGLDGIDGIPDPDGTGAGTATNPVAPVNGIQSILAIDGLLEVPVIFDDPFNLLLGFTDTNFDQLPDDRNNDGVINALDLVRIAVVFDDMLVNNHTNVNSVELMAIKRKKQLHGGGTAEIFFGARYLELDDRFTVNARGGTLADTNWDNHALNRIVGPQLGFRIAKSQQRWTTTIQGRFMAGANFLSVRQTGVVGSHLVNNAPGVPQALGGNAFFHRLSDEEFSPTGQLNYEMSYLLSRRVALSVAWTGTVVGGVTRAANTVAYRLPNLGILNRQEEVFTHGVTVGVEINR